MNVTVTGATGFVGRHVVSALLERGHSVTAIARNGGRARTLPWFGAVRFVERDVHMDTDAVIDYGEALIHLAWPGLPNYKSMFHLDKNLPGDFRFLRRAVAWGLRNVLVTGTCFEYGMQSGPLSESYTTAPSNPYGLAKDCLRKMLQSEGIPLTWVRLFYMYGEGQNPKSLIATLDAAIDRGDSSFNMSGGEQLRDFLPITKVASYLADLIEHPSSGVVNVCNGTPISVRRLVEERIKERGATMSLNLGHYPYPDYEPMAFWGDASKLESILK